MDIKTELMLSTIIAILLTLSPVLILLDHHTLTDQLDKFVLVLAAWTIVFLNLRFQNWVQTKHYTLFLTLFYTLLFNALLSTINIYLRIPLWNANIFRKPPLLFLIRDELIRTAIVAIISYFVVKFIHKSKKEIEDRQKISQLENETLQLQLKGLTAQLQPHFFFNNLNILSELIHIDIKKSEIYIQNLSNFFRYVLSAQQSPLVALKDEIKFTETYLYLLKIRFGDDFQIKIPINNTENYSVPSLCSLIIMENIVKHNDINQIQVLVEIDDDNQVLKIKNTRKEKKSIQGNNLGYGLENLNKKCELLLNRRIKIVESDTHFEVEIPLKKSFANGNKDNHH